MIPYIKSEVFKGSNYVSGTLAPTRIAQFPLQRPPRNFLVWRARGEVRVSYGLVANFWPSREEVTGKSGASDHLDMLRCSVVSADKLCRVIVMEIGEWHDMPIQWFHHFKKLFRVIPESSWQLVTNKLATSPTSHSTGKCHRQVVSCHVVLWRSDGNWTGEY